MTLIIWQGGKTDVRWAEINFISRGETVSIQFGINFSSFISFIFLSPRGSVARLFSRLHPNVFSLLFCADWHGAVQWELQKMLSPPLFFFLQSDWNVSVKCHALRFLCLCVQVKVFVTEQTEKVGRQGALRWKRRHDPFFCPILHPVLSLHLCSFSLAQRARQTFYSPLLLYFHCDYF